MNPPLILRTDASSHMGTGHLMRCLALAQAWKAQGGQSTFIMASESHVLRRRIRNEGFRVVQLERGYPDADDWRNTSQVLAHHPGAWLVLDGYHFDGPYQRRIKDAGHPLLVIDDMAHLDHYYADIILNQNIHADQLAYSCEPSTNLLLGTRYVLLRSEFSSWRGWQRKIPEVARKVLITLGGSDPNNVTLQVLEALHRVEMNDLEVVVVIGANNSHYEKLQSAILNSPIAIRLKRNITSMPEVMSWADVTVAAGGSTCWELAFMGLPSVILVLMENQETAVQKLVERKIFLATRYKADTKIQQITQQVSNLLLNRQLRQELSQNGNFLVDGLGASRVIEGFYRIKRKGGHHD